MACLGALPPPPRPRWPLRRASARPPSRRPRRGRDGRRQRHAAELHRRPRCRRRSTPLGRDLQLRPAAATIPVRPRWSSRHARDRHRRRRQGDAGRRRPGPPDRARPSRLPHQPGRIDAAAHRADQWQGERHPLRRHRRPATRSCSSGWADGAGGAVYVRDAALHVVDVTFRNNAAATPGPDVGGGAIYAAASLDVQVTGSTFDGNSASNGGAVGLLQSDGRFTNDVFTNNRRAAPARTMSAAPPPAARAWPRPTRAARAATAVRSPSTAAWTARQSLRGHVHRERVQRVRGRAVPHGRRRGAGHDFDRSLFQRTRPR